MVIPPLRVSAVGLEHLTVYLAHHNGGWGPEPPITNSDYWRHPLYLNARRTVLTLDVSTILVPDEEFKLVAPVSEVDEAWQIYQTRQAAGVHVGYRFDYDAQQRTFWLLTPGFPVVRFGEWNQNNICTLTADEQHHQQGKA
jgi:hypothetical protein